MQEDTQNKKSIVKIDFLWSSHYDPTNMNMILTDFEKSKKEGIFSSARMFFFILFLSM